MSRRRHQSCPLNRTRTKDGKNDQWFIRYRIDFLTGDGTTEYREAPPKYLGFCREVGKREAEKMRDELLTTINNPSILVPSQVLFSVVVNRYLLNVTVRDSSLRQYTSAANAHILPKWGHVRICDMKQFEIEQWLLQKSRGMSKQCFAKIKTVMANAWNGAVRWGYIQSANPISLLPKKFGFANNGRAFRMPSEDAFRRLIDEIQEPWKLAARIMAGTGLRASEVLGLQWSDFDSDTMTVRWTVDGRTKKRSEVTKTDASRRAIPVGHLRTLIVKTTGDWIFEPEYKVLQEEVVRAAKKVGIYEAGFGCHMFRRWHNTMFRRISGDVHLAMAQMGHTDLKTNDLYFFPGDQEMAERAQVAAKLMDQVTGLVQ